MKKKTKRKKVAKKSQKKNDKNIERSSLNLEWLNVQKTNEINM